MGTPANGAPRPDEILTWVHTCPPRDKTVGLTLASLDESDLAGRYEVRRHPEGLTLREKYEWWVEQLKQSADSGARYILRLEDDIVVNKHIAHNVCTWPALKEGVFGVGSLFLFDAFAEAPRLFRRAKSSGCLFKCAPDVAGSQAHLYEAKSLSRMLARFPEARSGHPDWAKKSVSCDWIATRAAWLIGLRTFLHEPSLADCNASAENSADSPGLKHRRPHKASTFDPDWKR